ncbi:hypothetical protein [uncultured Ruminococcus sp.]|uniref:hypothetical protein n=1 Tax=uncultured Ruminococcus sp. TaxID=165186 RepID=UPI0026313A0B|nr:hypothetical protein [uncultured Ruminococcus sp.]
MTETLNRHGSPGSFCGETPFPDTPAAAVGRGSQNVSCRTWLPDMANPTARRICYMVEYFIDKVAEFV